MRTVEGRVAGLTLAAVTREAGVSEGGFTSQLDRVNAWVASHADAMPSA